VSRKKSEGQEDMLSATDGPNDDNILRLPLHLNTIYLFKEKKSRLVYKKLELLIKDGFEALIITRAHPGRLKQTYGLGDNSIYWLSTNKIPDYPVISPTQISRLTTILVKFISNGQETKRVVLLDNLEYLIIQNEFHTLLRLLHLVRDKIMVQPALLLLPIDPGSLDRKELSLLESECELIDMKDY
jgi:two-component system cell cycle response regulator